MAKQVLTFDGSLNTMMKKLTAGRNGIQIHLENVGRLAAKFDNLEGYVLKTINALDEMGQHTYSEAALVWLEKYYGYTCDESGKQVEWKGKDFIKANWEAAKACKFWTLAKAKASSFKGYNFNDAVHATLTQADKMLKKVADGKLSEEDKLAVVIDMAQMRRVRSALAA
jgi:hypothetical protein